MVPRPQTAILNHVENHLTLQRLTYFIEVATAGSVTRAAARLFIAQPSLSKAMKELEAAVGLDLLRRTPQGVTLTPDGVEFLGYARQVTQQADLLAQRYLSRKPARRLCAISTQHYAFAVNAFVTMVERTDADDYEFALRETRTHDIIEDVATLRSDLGILFRSGFNRTVLDKLFRERKLVFHPLFTAQPHVFVSRTNPLARKQRVTLADLTPYPCLSFDQGEHNSFFFAEEILSTEITPKAIRVSDRATIFNLMIGLNGYTISTGILSADLNGEQIVSVPLAVDDPIEVGWIEHSAVQRSQQAELYLAELARVVAGYGFATAEI